MKPKLLATFLVGALALLVLVARPASAHDSGVNHWDGRVYHDYRYGGHVDRYFSPRGYEVDRVYQAPARPSYSYNRSYSGYNRPYAGHDCNDWHSSSSGYFNRPSSGYYNGYGYRRPSGYPSYNRGWWGW